MSRLTGSEAQSLMEAYNAVYAPQELTEEQIWEQVENWVNSLLEEGYDLSDYTWEEMYEAYLNEAPMTAFQAAGGQAQLDKLNKNRSPRAGRVTAAQLERRGQENLYKAGGGDAAIAKGPTRNQNVRGGGSVKVPTLTRQDIINRGAVAAAKPAAKPAPKPADDPAAPAAKPAVTSAAPKPDPKPAAALAKPAPGTKAAGPGSIKPKTPNPLMQKTFGYQTGNAPDQIAKASAGKPTPSGSALGSAADPKVRAALNLPSKSAASLSQAPAPKPAEAPKPQMSARAQALKTGGPAGSARERMLNQDLDIFDIIKGHLLDEGYADTEEGAMVIMANMSEEWKQSILNEDPVQDYRDMQRAKRDRPLSRDDSGLTDYGAGGGAAAEAKGIPRAAVIKQGAINRANLEKNNKPEKPGPSNNFGRGF